MAVSTQSAHVRYNNCRNSPEKVMSAAYIYTIPARSIDLIARKVLCRFSERAHRDDESVCSGPASWRSKSGEAAYTLPVAPHTQ